MADYGKVQADGLPAGANRAELELLEPMSPKTVKTLSRAELEDMFLRLQGIAQGIEQQRDDARRNICRILAVTNFTTPAHEARISKWSYLFVDRVQGCNGG